MKHLKTKTPEEQYKILKTWTLPVEGRKTIRMLAKFGPAESAPEAFVKSLLMITQAGQPSKQGIESSARLLVDAAEKTNKLAELEAEVQPLVEQKVDRARELLALIRMAQKRAKEAEPDVKLMMMELRGKSPKEGERPEAPWAKFLVAREAMFDPDLRPVGQELAGDLMMATKTAQNHQMLADLRYQHSRSLMLNNPETKHAGGADPGLKWWRSAVEQTCWTHAAGNAPSWWVSHAGIVSHVCGPENQFLYFLYPLTGTFEFHVDGFCGGWGEGNVGYGGLTMIGIMNGGQTQISPHGLSETIYRPIGPKVPDRFNRHTIQVQPGKMRYMVNKTLLYEDKDPSHHAPWLALYTGRAQRTGYRNFQLTGQPVIPREVRLMDGDRLEGWLSNFYSESQPPRRTVGQPQRYDANQIVARDPSVTAYDWAAQDGIIHGRKLNAATQQPQSRLYYHRPLEDGDTLSYEFLYEPDATHVHPALDRMTYLLEPSGVRLHWMTDGVADPASDLGPENVIDQPTNRRGPAALPLLLGKWNTLRISLQLPTVRLELNGQMIYEAALDPTNTLPDLVVSFRWTEEKNEFDAPGYVLSEGSKRGAGTHASLSRFDMHNTLIGQGPDFRAGFITDLPSSNADVAPTILSILGIKPPQPMDGRVLSEAFVNGKAPEGKPQTEIKKVSRELGLRRWEQYLKLTTFGGAFYVDEGNGTATMR